MKFETKVLKDAVATASKAVMPNSPIPALSGIRIDKVDDAHVKVTGQSSDTLIEMTVEASEIDGFKTAIIDAKMLRGIVEAVSGEVLEIQNIENNLFEVNSGGAKFKVLSFDPKEWPEMAGAAGAVTMPMTAPMIRDIVTKVGYCSSSDENRPVLTGVNLHIKDDTCVVSATDSFRMAIKEIVLKEPSSGEVSITVPTKRLKMVYDIFKDVETEIEVKFDSKRIEFAEGDVRIITSLLEGGYPDVSRLIPVEFEQEIKFEKDLMLSAIKRAKLFGNNNTSPLSIRLSGDTASLKIRNPEIGDFEEELPIKRGGGSDDYKISYLPDYVFQAINAIDTDEVTMKIAGTMKPALLTGEDSSEKAIILPVRTYN